MLPFSMKPVSTISYKEFTFGIFSYLMYGMLTFLLSAGISSFYIPLPRNLSSMLLMSLFLAAFQFFCQKQIIDLNINFSNAVLCYFAYSAVLGMYCSYIFLLFNFEDIIKASIGAGIISISAYLFGKYAKFDLTEIYDAARYAIIICIISIFVNYFLQVSLLFFAIDIILLCSIPVAMAYFSQYFQVLYYQASDEERSRLQLIAALHLLINFVNLLIIILRLFFNNKKRSE